MLVLPPIGAHPIGAPEPRVASLSQGPFLDLCTGIGLTISQGIGMDISADAQVVLGFAVVTGVCSFAWSYRGEVDGYGHHNIWSLGLTAGLVTWGLDAYLAPALRDFAENTTVQRWMPDWMVLGSQIAVQLAVSFGLNTVGKLVAGSVGEGLRLGGMVGGVSSALGQMTRLVGDLNPDTLPGQVPMQGSIDNSLWPEFAGPGGLLKGLRDRRLSQMSAEHDMRN